MQFFTIGYGGRRPEDFLALLKEHGVQTLVDVRIHPHRASMGAYVRTKSPNRGIERLLSRVGIEYVSVPELGNPFKDEADWEGKYIRLLEDRSRLRKLDDVRKPFCLLCAEKRVADCHRRLIADAMVAQGHTVRHIE